MRYFRLYVFNYAVARATGIKHLVAVVYVHVVWEERRWERGESFSGSLRESMACVHGERERRKKRRESRSDWATVRRSTIGARKEKMENILFLKKKMYINKYENVFFFFFFF